MPASTRCSPAVARERVRHEREVEAEPKPSSDRHGGRRDPRGVVGVEETVKRRADPAGGEEPIPQLVPALEQLAVDGGVAVHRVRPAELADVAAEDHPGLERHQVARLRPARPGSHGAMGARAT